MSNHNRYDMTDCDNLLYHDHFYLTNWSLYYDIMIIDQQNEHILVYL